MPEGGPAPGTSGWWQHLKPEQGTSQEGFTKKTMGNRGAESAMCVHELTSSNNLDFPL